jgi:hypothetical protein
MVAVPIPPTGPYAPSRKLSSGAEKSDAQDWTKYVAAGTLLAGGALMLAGNRRAGLVVAAAGTVLALMDEQPLVESWWKNLPGYLREAEGLIDKVEGYIEDASAQGHKIQSMLRR